MENLYHIMEVWFDENATTPEETELENYVTIDDFKTYCDGKPFPRRQFKYPSYRDLMTAAESLVPIGCRELSKPQVAHLLRLWEMKPDAEHELLLAFQVLDTENRGALGAGTLAAALGARYDAFDACEVREFLRDADIRGHGDLYYTMLVRSMFSKAPQLRDEPVDFLYSAEEDPTVLPEDEVQVNPLENVKGKSKLKLEPKAKVKKAKK